MRGLSPIVQTITRWVAGPILLYGIYTICYGHLTPGGGFAGGVVIASAFVLIMLAYGKQRLYEDMRFTSASRLDCTGALMFLAVALLGLAYGSPFFVNFIQKRFPGLAFHLFSAGIIPVCNVAIAIKVSASLALIAVALSVLRVVPGGSDEEFIAEEEE